MDLVVLTRRGISFQQVRRGEQHVLYVPADENIKTYKDITDSHNIAERYGASGQPPLWRLSEGQAVVYGVLPAELSQRRQAMRVWLPQDFAPADCTAFYYILNKTRVVHGVREIDDEGHEDWRVTMLKSNEAKGQVVQMVAESVSELMLTNVEARICVAVYENVDLYQEAQTALQPFEIQPIPFSNLGPNPKAKPLYKQRDFSALMYLSLLALLLALLGVCALWFTHWSEVEGLNRKIADVRQQILNIQINKNIGQIREPERMLDMMKKPFAQKPSAIVDAAARFGMEFGHLEAVVFEVEKSNQDLQAIYEIGPGQYMVRAIISKPTNKLLIDQELLSNILMEKSPWIRRVENNPTGFNELTLDILVQAETPEGDQP